MKIDFKLLRVDILSKLFLKINLIEILKFSCWYSPITLGFQLGNKYFLKFLKVDNLFIKKITNGFKMFLFILND